jgi:hypothetical protein
MEKVSDILDNETLESFSTTIQCQYPEEKIQKKEHMVISYITN